jgi:thymidylate synthase ThyX
MDIFTLTDDEGQLFPPVRQAATFAKYSRSPNSARELAQQTTELAAEKFQQKWIVDFGHNAIAELATIPVAFEGVSIVASKAIEAWERPGVCEKSTRMQVFNRDSLYVPDGIEPTTLERLMPLVEKCFFLYNSLLEELPSVLAEQKPNATQAQLNRAAFDIARYLLPAGCRTNLGICAYPRDLAEMISVLSGSPNPEFCAIGQNLKAATEALGGPLIRHTEPDTWAGRIPLPKIHKNLGLTGFENIVLPTGTNIDETQFWTLLRRRYGMSPVDLMNLMKDRPEHHSVPKVFREVQLSYSIYMDYGAFRDLQRHRRMDQFVEPLSPVYGFALPPGLETSANLAYWKMRKLFMEFPEVTWPEDPMQQMLCQYLIPLAFRVGWHVTMDLQQLYYLVELRTQEAGHPSYRQVSYDLWDHAASRFPFLTQWIRPRGPRP